MNFKLYLESRRQMAIVSGITLLLMAIVAGIGFGYAFNSFYSYDSPKITLAKLQDMPAQLDLLIYAFVAVLILDILVSFSFYFFFKNNRPKLSLTTCIIRLIYSLILGYSIFQLFQLKGLLIQGELDLDGLDYLESFLNTWSMGLIVFGIHLTMLGILFLQTGDTPKWTSVLMIFAGISYCIVHVLDIDSLGTQGVKSQLETVLGAPMALGELIPAIWIMVLGFRNKINQIAS